MDMQIKALEDKIEQVVGLVLQLRAENETLRGQIAASEMERFELREKMTAARERLEGLLEKLPEDA